MAVNWKKFQETKSTYPNLEYTPSRAANPRDSHRVYWGKIWAIDDPIWDTIMPPSEWNCLCGVRPTNKPVTVLPDGWQQPETDPVFRNNPGKTAEIVNTEKTDYYQSAPEQKRPMILMLAMNFAKKESGEVVEKYVGKKGGYVKIVRQNKNEAAKNAVTYKIMADNGGRYTLRGVSNTGKSPDAINDATGWLSDAKHPQTVNGKNAVQASIKNASKQGAEEVIIRLAQNYSNHSLWAGLKAAFHNERSKKVKAVVIIRNGLPPWSIDLGKFRGWLKKQMATKR